MYVFVGGKLLSDTPKELDVCDPARVRVTGPGMGHQQGDTYPQDKTLVWEVDCERAGPGSVTVYTAGPRMFQERQSSSSPR